MRVLFAQQKSILVHLERQTSPANKEVVAPAVVQPILTTRMRETAIRSASPLPLVVEQRESSQPVGVVPLKRVPRRTPRSAPGGKALPSAALVAAVVVAGFFFRDSIPVKPDAGVGYCLGIAGGVTVLLLSLYAARKNTRFMRRWGKLHVWFRLHMLLGVLAPLLILFHSNFRLGAPNSNVALASILLVSMSGAVGRFLYTRINHGLYGARATLEELHDQLDLSAHTLGALLPPTSEASLRLVAFADASQGGRDGRLRHLLRVAALPWSARRVGRRVSAVVGAELDREAERSAWTTELRDQHGETTKRLVEAYLAALVKERQFRVFERLASLWHAVHVPLLVMLLVSGVLHVIAVHMY